MMRAVLFTATRSQSLSRAYSVFLRVADFDPEDVVQQPVDGLLLVEHEDELHDEVQVRSLEHFSYRNDDRTNHRSCKGRLKYYCELKTVTVSLVLKYVAPHFHIGVSAVIWIRSLPNQITLQ